MRTFVLHRLVDETGVSGTGIVACGVEFANGKVVVCWMTDHSSVAVFDNITDVAMIHGHNGSTEITWLNKNHYPNLQAIMESRGQPA